MTQVKVKVLTINNLQISGKLRVSPFWGNYCQKVSDLLNNSRSFIELVDVTVYDDNQLLVKMPSLCINKPAIAFLGEEETV